MIVATLPDNSSRIHRNETFCDALKSIGTMAIRSIQGEGLCDELYETGQRPDDDRDDAEDRMEVSLDDAA
jgi:hypothetical protein